MGKTLHADTCLVPQSTRRTAWKRSPFLPSKLRHPSVAAPPLLLEIWNPLFIRFLILPSISHQVPDREPSIAGLRHAASVFSRHPIPISQRHSQTTFTVLDLWTDLPLQPLKNHPCPSPCTTSKFSQRSIFFSVALRGREQPGGGTTRQAAPGRPSYHGKPKDSSSRRQPPRTSGRAPRSGGAAPGALLPALRA